MVFEMRPQCGGPRPVATTAEPVMERDLTGECNTAILFVYVDWPGTTFVPCGTDWTGRRYPGYHRLLRRTILVASSQIRRRHEVYLEEHFQIFALADFRRDAKELIETVVDPMAKKFA